MPTGYPETAEFWAAATDGRLILRTCDDCDEIYHYPRDFCPNCFSNNVQWIEASGRGEVYSYSVSHQMSGWPDEDLPLIIVYIELSEGVRMPSHLLDTAPENVSVGDPVEVTFVPTQDDDVAIPVFKCRE